MRLDDNLLSYLRGEQFSNGLSVAYSFDERDFVLRSRIEWLRDFCTGKKVVHVGCLDHDIDMVKHKRKRGKWLHGELQASAARVLGVDINAQGIAQLEQELGVKGLLAADLLSDACEPIFSDRWNVFLLAEVLEHIGDPVAFLTAMRTRFAGVVDEFVITVPNAFAREVRTAAVQGKEVINSDHRFWFTPYTLAKVCIDAGLTPSEIVLCKNGVIKRRSVLKNWRARRLPLLRNGIILRAGVS